MLVSYSAASLVVCKSTLQKRCQAGQAAIDFHTAAVAIAMVKVAAAARTQALAIRPAQGLHLQRCLSILPYRLREIEHMVAIDYEGILIGALVQGPAGLDVHRSLEFLLEINANRFH